MEKKSHSDNNCYFLQNSDIFQRSQRVPTNLNKLKRTLCQAQKCGHLPPQTDNSLQVFIREM